MMIPNSNDATSIQLDGAMPF